MKNILFVLLICVISLAGCDQKSHKASEANLDSAKSISEILKADIAWDSLSALNSAEGWCSFYTDDAIMMPPGEKMCADKASRLASIKGMFAIPGASMRFQGTKIEVSKSGELGYSTGVYQFKSKDATGKEALEIGKFCETWKKQADGSWKCIVDIWNADPAK